MVSNVGIAPRLREQPQEEKEEPTAQGMEKALIYGKKSLPL